MLLVGLGLGVHGAVAHILHRHGTGNDQHFVQRLAVPGLQNHAAHAGVKRQAGQFFANGREFVVVVHRAQFGQQLVTIGDGAARGGFDERKVFNHAQVQRLHAQDHPGQRGAQNFRIGEAGACSKVFFVVKANTNTVGHTPAPPCPLVGSGLADGFDQQLFHFAAQAVALDAGRACVNHIPNTGHGERGFGHVGGQHNSAPIGGLKNLVLLGLRQSRKQRQHFSVARQGLVRKVFAQVVGRFANLAFAGQKDQDVARCPTEPKFVYTVGNGFIQAVVARFFKRPPALFHRKGTARHHDDGCVAFAGGKVLGKTVSVDGGRSDHHLQVGAARQDLPQIAQ